MARRVPARVIPAPAIAVAGARNGVAEVFTALMALFKLRIGVAITASALAGAIVALGAWPSGAALDLIIAVMLASSGAAGCNHYFERDLDAQMRRTSGRPFVTGTFRESMLWPLLFTLMIVGGSGWAAWRIGLLSGLFVLAGALTYAVVYTLWLKRLTHWNIVIGGFAGSWAVLAGAAIGPADALLSPGVLLLALVLFLWTPSHFWALSIAVADDYRRAAVPMLPVVQGPHAAAVWILVNSLALSAAAVMFAVVVNHPLVWAGALGGGGYLLLTGWRLLQDPVAARAGRAFRASLVQLTALLGALFAAGVV
jgi:heme o synthase